ncbi:MAG: UDP-N-acetylmuramoyl-tripeptide--D-alanyl-D-alanine ligase [Clostridiales bacterium]|nr:UDP-N-acetylmuramoyl-tripeptide--D-alanyl-D-alanine ligase [Clostridiales bacterium]
MSVFTLAEIVDVTGGKLLQFDGEASPAEYKVNGVCTDTRVLEKGNLFLALIGEKYDGHDFAVRAATDGASAFVASSMEKMPKDKPVVLVEDTKIALEKLAEYYRKRLGCKVVAVTGSVGKTSTREMIASTLRKGLRTHVTKDNMNNEIGLSLTILQAPEDSEVLVLEMGMRLRGEISELTHIAHPDVAVITTIGVAHIERLGSQEEILAAKLEIQEALCEGGLLIIPYHDKMLAKAVREGMIRDDVRIGYTSCEKDDADILSGAFGMAVSSPVSVADERLCFDVLAGFEEKRTSHVKLKAIGFHHVGNALTAFLCGLYLGLSPETITQGIESFEQIGHREKLVDVEGVHFLDDAYNAGPESMKSAFTSIRRLAGEEKAYACIADMLELGDVSAKEHFGIGVKAAEEKLDGVFVMGDYQESVREGVLSLTDEVPVYGFSNKKAMAEKLATIVKPGDYVLLKASHSFEMHLILNEYGSVVRGGDEP